MLEMKKMTEAIQELRGRNGTVPDQSLASDIKNMNHTVSELVKRNERTENLIIKMAEKQRIPLSHI